MSAERSTPSVLLAAMYQRLVEVDGWKWQANYEAVDRVLRAVIEVTDVSQPDSRLMQAWSGDYTDYDPRENWLGWEYGP